MLALGADVLTVLWIASLLLVAGTILSQKKPKAASQDDFLGSTATQGAYIPLVIGRERVAPVFAFVEDATTFGLTDEGGGGTGFGKGLGGVPQPPSYQENGLHILCVGPANLLSAIYQNGELIWKGAITPVSHPSGSSVTLANSEGTFKVYWGFRDDPTINVGLATSRFPLAMKVLWEPKNLGQSRQWPRLEYEVTCPCYSQIANSPSQIALEGDDLVPTFDTWIEASQGVGYVPSGRAGSDRAVFEIVGYDSATRELIVIDVFRTNSAPVASPPATPIAQSTALPALFLPAGIAKVFTYNNTISAYDIASHDNNLSSLLPNGVWKYFWIVRSYQSPATSISLDPNPANRLFCTGAIRMVLGPEVLPGTVRSLLPSGTGPVDTSASTPKNGFVSMVGTDDTDGVNPIHMVDQLLFSKYPYGAARDRSRFDSRSIEAAAEVLASEKIRGSIAIRDGEGLESALSPVLQDIGLMIVWDVEVGKYVFRVIRYQEAAIDLPREIILNQPEMLAIQGDRPVDVVAFTYKDRKRNYREVPIRVFDSGQITEHESQRARKAPIEVTKDRDSVSRIAPRRQQEALTNLVNTDFETNHACALAMPGSVFSADAVEGSGIQFLITEVQREVNSSKVVISTVIDSYNAPLLDGTDEAPRLEDIPTPPPVSALVEQLDDFLAVELPYGRSIQILFLASRRTTQTVSAAVFGSRDGSAFSGLGSAVVAVRGTLDADLPAGPMLVEGPISFSNTLDSEISSIEDLTLDEDSWRAGRQVMLIGDEVIYLKNGYPNDLVGLLRGRAGSSPAAHVAGTPFYILLSHRIEPVTSLMFVAGKDLVYKVQALSSKRGSDITQVAEKTLSMTGKAFTPRAPRALRLPDWRSTYSTALANLRIVWCFFSDEFPNTGIGTQPLGSAIGTSPVQGHFAITLKNHLAAVVHTAVAETNELVLSLSDRTGIGLDALPSWTIEIVHVKGAFSSYPASLTLTPS